MRFILNAFMRGQPFFVGSFQNFAVVCIRVALLACFQLAFHANLALAFEAPAFQGDVLDEAEILSEQDKHALLKQIQKMRANSGIWAAIYVARDLQQDSIENAAVATFEKWKLGQPGKDNGLLILIAPSERKTRIEVGYGLEGFITDTTSKRVIDQVYGPAFRDQQYAEGLLQGFSVMERLASGEQALSHSDVKPVVKTPPPDWSRVPRYFWITLSLNLAPAFLYMLALVYGRSKERREESTLWNSIHVLINSGGVLGVIFGILIAVFGVLSAADPEVMMVFVVGNILLASLFVFPFALKARRFLFDSAYRRHQARERLFKIRRRSKIARKIFGVLFEPSKVSVSLGGTQRKPRYSDEGFSTKTSATSFSSTASDNKSSSSSGGGSSGGGGASGKW